MKTYSTAEHKHFSAEIKRRGIQSSGLQVFESFLEGQCGEGLIQDQSSAVLIFDIVELSGPFEEEIYNRLMAIEEAHLFAPPAEWKEAILSRFEGDWREYRRVEFHTLDLTSTKAVNPPSPLDFDIKPITPEISEELLKEEWSKDLVANTLGQDAPGFVAFQNERVIGGIGCYTLYNKGIEVEIDTHEDFRRRGVAYNLSLAMIEECRKRNLEMHWDAMNSESASLAKKLGFIPSREYTAIQLNGVWPDEDNKNTQ